MGKDKSCWNLWENFPFSLHCFLNILGLCWCLELRKGSSGASHTKSRAGGTEQQQKLTLRRQAGCRFHTAWGRGQVLGADVSERKDPKCSTPGADLDCLTTARSQPNCGCERPAGSGFLLRPRTRETMEVGGQARAARPLVGPPIPGGPLASGLCVRSIARAKPPCPPCQRAVRPGSWARTPGLGFRGQGPLRGCGGLGRRPRFLECALCLVGSPFGIRFLP